MTTSATPRRRFWSIIDTTVWIVAILSAVGIALAVQVGGFQITRVLSPSMEPTFAPGDLVIIRPVPAVDIKPGDIPMLPDPDLPQIQYVHRVQQVDASRPGEVWILTKGDNNPSEDSPVTVVTENVPVVVASIPMGKIPLTSITWNWSVLLLGAMVVVFLALMFLPSRRGQDGDDPELDTEVGDKEPADMEPADAVR